VIRGDLPAAAGLTGVWLELRKTLASIVDPAPPAFRPTKVAARLASADPLPADLPEPDEAGDAEAGQ